MPSNTITDRFTFSNWGPVTTFSAPASCATATDAYRIGVEAASLLFQYNVQCSTYGYYDCIPTGSVSTSRTQDLSVMGYYQQSYYSPGLHCPSGWETVGMASRDGEKPVTSSGILDIASSTSDHATSYMARWQNPLTILPELLDPSETLVMCCPSSMTADIFYGCYSPVPDYTVTEACFLRLGEGELATSTKTYTANGAETTDVVWIYNATGPANAFTTSLNATGTKTPMAFSVLPMLPLVHRPSDLKGTGTAAATSTTTETTTPMSTSNSATRAVLTASSWDKLGGVLGVSFAAMVLGAAIVVL